jgi:hypothetical protein
MSTPVINALDNVNQSALESLFASVATTPQARDNLSQSNRNIDRLSQNVGVIEALNTSEDAILRILCRREGRDPATFADLDAVAADQGLMQSIAARQQSAKILCRSQKASASMAGSQTAMQEMVASPTARQEMVPSPTAMQEVSASQTAMDECISSQSTMQEIRSVRNADEQFHRSDSYMSALELKTGLSLGTDGGMDDVKGSSGDMGIIASSQAGRDELFASEVAMEEVASSSTAMQEFLNRGAARSDLFSSQLAMEQVARDSTAMNLIAPNSTFMQEVADSQPAMAGVANSGTAMSIIGSNSNENVTASTVLNSQTATAELRASSLKRRYEEDYFNARRAGGRNITNARVLVTSNNNNGDDRTGINFNRDVGSRTQQGTTFIINSANMNGGRGTTGGDISFRGITL